MEFIDPEIEKYASENSTVEDPFLKDVAKITREKLDAPSMMVGHLEGMFLEMLVFALSPNRVLEIGTFSGYSSISMAKALKPGAVIDTLDFDEKHIHYAKKHIKEAGLEHVIFIHEGDARTTIQNLTGPYDFIFIDADKSSYEHYLNHSLKLLSQNGIIAVDNTLWSKRVLDPNDNTEDTVALRKFNQKVAENPNLRAVITTVRDGVTLIRKVN